MNWATKSLSPRITVLVVETHIIKGNVSYSKWKVNLESNLDVRDQRFVFKKPYEKQWSTIVECRTKIKTILVMFTLQKQYLTNHIKHVIVPAIFRCRQKTECLIIPLSAINKKATQEAVNVALFLLHNLHLKIL